MAACGGPRWCGCPVEASVCPWPLLCGGGGRVGAAAEACSCRRPRPRPGPAAPLPRRHRGRGASRRGHGHGPATWEQSGLRRRRWWRGWPGLCGAPGAGTRRGGRPRPATLEVYSRQRPGRPGSSPLLALFRAWPRLTAAAMRGDAWSAAATGLPQEGQARGVGARVLPWVWRRRRGAA